jgi:hypothetical protein
MPNSKGKLTICVDFDGVIHKYTHWNSGLLNAQCIDYAPEALQSLRNLGHTIIIHTTRDEEEIKQWLETFHVPYDYINENPEIQGRNPGKPIADIYVDDRAIQFNGNWSTTYYEILNFTPWYLKGTSTIPEDRLSILKTIFSLDTSTLSSNKEAAKYLKELHGVTDTELFNFLSRKSV